MKVSATLFETRTASGTCRNRPRVTGGTGGQVSGSGEVVDGDAFRRSREFSSCDSDGGGDQEHTFTPPSRLLSWNSKPLSVKE